MMGVRAETNTITYVPSISACGKCEEWQLALGMLNVTMMGVIVETNTITYVQSIGACGGANDILEAYLVVNVQGMNRSAPQLLAHETRQSVLAEVTGSERPSWKSTSKVLKENDERLCRVMENTLVGRETPDLDRNPLCSVR